MTRRILMGLSEWGYWGEELVGPLETFDKEGYEVDFFTPTGKRAPALPPSMDPNFIDPPLGRTVTTPEMAAKFNRSANPPASTTRSTSPSGSRGGPTSVRQPISARWRRTSLGSMNSLRRSTQGTTRCA